jgi:predicted nuclease of predicted toxin-antitoxin system
MNLLIDMNLTSRWVTYLSGAGHRAVHWSTAGSPSAEDEEICSYARDRSFVVLTNDLDLPRILACTGASGLSVILLKGSPLTPEARAAALLLILTNKGKN